MQSVREKIVFAAMQLFAEKGYGSTSVAEILSKADVNAGSLYYVFPGKQDVLIAVLDAYLHGIEPMLLAPAWKGVADPIERVFALLAAYRKALMSTGLTYGCPIGSIALELHEPDPPVRKLLAKNFDGWVNAIEKCFADAGDRLPEDVDRRGLALLALTTMEGGVMVSRTDRKINAFDTAIAMFRDYIDRLQSQVAAHST
ncbi:MAG TPA: TetR/AcrR family transcriptional regulator [Gemmatimonadaceae bacterium]|nr:TetR/AcrR family transcriptional regulator [Gemmatimonadaceae bacterium]